VTHLHDLFPEADLEEAVDAALVRKRQHPSDSLTLLNYTERCQYENIWTPVTTACRGLIYNTETLEVVARPLRKFMNLEQIPDFDLTRIPHADVYEKLDGSLGILYPQTDGTFAIATRGSFESEQAIWATDYWRKHHADFVPPPGVTLLFEVLYASNRIVVSYDTEELVALTSIDIATGRTTAHYLEFPGSIVQHHGKGTSYDRLKADRPNAEGYVLHFPDTDERVKLKHLDYIRLHRLVTGTTERTIHSILSSGESLDELRSSAPDELTQWINDTAANLFDQFNELETGIHRDYEDIVRSLTQESIYPEDTDYRKEFALRARVYPHTAPLFTLLDNRSIDEYVWKQIKPATTTPFREDAE
jgi:RNA ligase